ncbi:MAG: TSUP family transporter [Acidobacteriota bacterium]
MNAAFGLAGHTRLGTVKWPCALVFAASGAAGALVGAVLGKAIDGMQLLALFGLVLIAVGLSRRSVLGLVLVPRGRRLVQHCVEAAVSRHLRDPLAEIRSQ